MQLKAFLKKEEAEIRHDTVHRILKTDIIARIKVAKGLSKEAYGLKDYQEALDSGFVDRVRGELNDCYRLGVNLESWLNTYQPPLSAGGTAAISSDVQDGIFGHIHTFANESSDAIVRMLAYEKDRALMRTKVTDEEVWKRYEAAMVENQLHDLRRTCLALATNLVTMSAVLVNNVSHLTSHKKSDRDSISVF